VTTASSTTASTIIPGQHRPSSTQPDNGIGLPEDVARSGLLNLERRARECDGTISVSANPGGGTRLVWRVPLPDL
jgi:nitrate/nitrite-specific signal transduction histidine kinase